jgi:L-asparaginase
MKIQIFTTGGTIDKIYFDAKNSYKIGDPAVVEVLKEANVSVEYDVVSLLRKDSLDLDDTDRRRIFDAVAAASARRIIITHGTDTMVLTARRLKTIVDKTIVLTGAMQPAKFRFTDAVFNIGAAVTAVQVMPPGVYIAMNGRIFDAGRVTKNVELNRFEES